MAMSIPPHPRHPRLERLRNIAKMTRRAVGERVAVSPDQVRRWERGVEPILDPYPALLAHLFGVDVRFLFGEVPS